MVTMMKLSLLVAVSAAALACAAGLSVMSVDLGSEFMKIAIVKPGVPMEIAYNKESKRKTPVIVSIKDGERLFGDPALSVGIRYPKNAYKYLLDLLGKKASNPIVKNYLQRFPYYDIESDPDTGMVVFRHDADTTYTVEELVAMILEKAKEIASDFAEQPITEAVITVPPFFNQAERRALLRSGELAGIKVLQILNDNTAVALNYGVFRRKEFNGTAMYYMFFDMGTYSTTATVVAYQVVKAKNPTTGIEETFPQLSIKGIGFDRTLGGLEYQLRLRDQLAKLFTATKKTKSDVFTNARSMEKLFKEAGRLKQVLSANSDHYSQIEGLLDDEDFRAKVTREEFEDMNADLFERIDKVIQDALKSSEITLGEISEVILMGGATRVPKVQEEIQKSVGRQELGKSINTDEAAALGASYQAAHLSKGYKVKKFGIKDANIFPIQVEFQRVRTTEDSTDSSKTVKRTLFGRMNPFPQKKVMTFNKHVKDFTFSVNYADLGFLADDFLEGFGHHTLQEVALLGVEDVHIKNKEATAKGTKTHFRMDDNGILSLDKVETLFEKMVDEEVEVKEESTLSKIGSTISSFFGGGDDQAKSDAEGTVEENKEEKQEQKNADPKEETKSEEEVKEEKPKEEDSPPTEDEKPSKKENDEDANEEIPDKNTEQKNVDKSEEKDKEPEVSSEPPSDTTEDDKSNKSEPEKPDDEAKDKDGEKVEEKIVTKTVSKPVTLKEEIKSDTLFVDIREPTSDRLSASRKKIQDMRKKDEEKQKLELSKNELESFIFNTQDKLYQELYEKSSTEDERQEYQTKLSEASDWLYEQEDDTERKAYEDKLSELKKMTSGLFDRVREHEERPKALEALNSIMNYTEYFLGGMKNLSLGEDAPFTDVEVSTLEKLITSTKEWNTTMIKEQSEVPAHEQPKLLIADIGRKMADLDREVKYLLNKMKTFRPKPKPKAEEKTPANDTKTKDEATKSKDKSQSNDTKEKEAKIVEEEPETEASDGDTPPDSSTPEEEETLQLPAGDSEETATEMPETATHNPEEL